MNIFYMSNDPKTCAQYHCDKHVVKMIIEYAQLLSTAHRILDGNHYFDKTANGRRISRWKLNDDREDKLYKASHVNHPCGFWVREDFSHYQWLWNLAHQLCQEYRHRYGGDQDKQHKTSLVIHRLQWAPDMIPRTGYFKEPPQAMPQDAKIPGDSIAAYRNYYRMYKNRFATWKNRETPSWYINNKCKSSQPYDHSSVISLSGI
jgi:hypothetical protein